MEITVYIPDESVELLEEGPLKVAQELVDKELLRRWHVKRSKPRERKPIGRPPVNKRLRELVSQGNQMFQKLQQIAGVDFNRVYGIYFAQFDALCKAENVIALEDFLERRDWQRRGR